MAHFKAVFSKTCTYKKVLNRLENKIKKINKNVNKGNEETKF